MLCMGFEPRAAERSAKTDCLNDSSIEMYDFVSAGIDVIKLFWRNSGKSRFPPKLKQQEQAILKAINSFRVYICLKLALFSHFSAGSDIRTNFIPILILGKSRFPPKKY